MDAKLKEYYQYAKEDVDNYYSNLMNDLKGFHPIVKHNVKSYYKDLTYLLNQYYYKTENELLEAVNNFMDYVNYYRDRFNLPLETE